MRRYIQQGWAPKGRSISSTPNVAMEVASRPMYAWKLELDMGFDSIGLDVGWNFLYWYPIHVSRGLKNCLDYHLCRLEGRHVSVFSSMSYVMKFDPMFPGPRPRHSLLSLLDLREFKWVKVSKTLICCGNGSISWEKRRYRKGQVISLFLCSFLSAVPNLSLNSDDLGTVPHGVITSKTWY